MKIPRTGRLVTGIRSGDLQTGSRAVVIHPYYKVR
jgi:hypothetical protein